MQGAVSRIVLIGSLVGCGPARTPSQDDGDSDSGSPTASTPTTSTPTSGKTTAESTTAADAGEATAWAPDSDTTHGAASTGAAESSSTAAPVDPVWQAFLDSREGLLVELAVPILACSDNMDTGHPAFHGCVDWHSHVHATYALHVLYRVTGEAQYLDAAQDTLTPDAVAAELADLQLGGIPQEVPYGYAWFLVLAVERELATGATDLRPLAEEIATQLAAWLDNRTPAQIQAGILADDYGNLSWTVLQLWRWAQHTGNGPQSAAAEAFVAEELMEAQWDAACPLLADTTDIDDFFPACLHRAMAIVTIAAPADSAAWQRRWLTDAPVFSPLGPAEIVGAHQGGLNFSRAWGLYALWQATDDPIWRDQYIDHVVTHVEQPQFWAENYYAFAHWVAQFGVYAIAATY